MSQQLTSEQRRKRIEFAVKAVGAGIIGLVAAPFIITAAWGVAGIIVIGAVSIITINFIPVFASMVANWRLKALKAEASRNPVETLQNDYVKRQEALVEFKDAIKTFVMEVQTFSDKLSEFVKQYPDDADKFRSQLDKMKQLLKLREKKYKQAQQGLEAYHLEIQKAGAIWDMGQAAARMNEAAGLTEEDFFSKKLLNMHV